MSASANKQPTTDDLKRWVRESIEFDLIYDEENYIEAAGWGFGTVDEAHKLIENNRSEDLFITFDKSKDLTLYNCYFQSLKMRRVFYDLEYDRARKQFAYSSSRSNDEYSILCYAHEVRGEILDGIMWRCAAAMSDLKLRELKKEEEEKEVCATLIALFHSELCASGRQDIAFGHANSFRTTVDRKAQGYDVFEWIANHNIARGYNHLRLPLKAPEYIDFQVDEFPVRIDDLAESIGTKDSEKDKSILYRALFFPTTLTLAQALGDVNRHTEQRYYLERARKEARDIKACYWWMRLQLDLDIEWRDSAVSLTLKDETTERIIGWEKLPARFEEALNTAISACPELVTNEGDSKKRSWDDWEKSEKWLLGWQSADSIAFGRHLMTLASGMSELWKGRNPKKKYIPCEEVRLLESIVVVLNVIRANLKLFDFERAGRKIPDICCLVPDGSRAIEDSSERGRPELWSQGSALFAIIRDLKKGIKDVAEKLGSQEEDINNKRLKELLEWDNPPTWENHLKKLLEGKDVFDKFRSEVMKAKLLEECQRSKNCGQSPVCPVAKTDTDDEKIPCLVYALPEGEAINKVDGKPLIRYDYYKSVMAAQQKHFLTYLKPRTGRMRSFRQGEAERPSPKFEIICLRRWNSFSPNLGSRAAATVGGGYFVRAWAKKRYIGIAIDPGYNFLENLFNEGFTIADIDLVVVTHAHPDHVENLTNLLTLLRERRSRLKNDPNCNPRTSPRDHKISLAVSEGVFERYERHFDNEEDFIREVVVLSAGGNCKDSEEGGKNSRGNEAGKNKLHLKLVDNYGFHMGLDEEDGACVVLSAARAWHHDGTDHDTIGVVIEYRNPDKKGSTDKKDKEDNKNPTIGIIGDSRYHPELYKDYEECDVVVTHVGGLVGTDMYKGHHDLDNGKAAGEAKTSPEETFYDDLRGLLESENHLYYPGIALLTCDLQGNSEKFPLMVLSEFGEELRGGLRKDLARRLSHCLMYQGKDPLPIKPADVGLRIDIEEREIFCCICNDYYKPEDITPETVLPHEESMAYVCDSCRELRKGELTTLLEQWCSTTRPVAPLEYDKTLLDDPKRDQAKS